MRLCEDYSSVFRRDFEDGFNSLKATFTNVAFRGGHAKTPPLVCDCSHLKQSGWPHVYTAMQADNKPPLRDDVKKKTQKAKANILAKGIITTEIPSDKRKYRKEGGSLQAYFLLSGLTYSIPKALKISSSVLLATTLPAFIKPYSFNKQP